MITVSYTTPDHIRFRRAVDRATSRALAGVQAATEYSLTLRNQSSSNWTFFVYQQPPQELANAFSVAWFASPFIIVHGNYITFRWSIDYGFVWGTTGIVQPGVTFEAGGDQDADLQSANMTTFGTDPGPNLSSPEIGTPQGSLIILDDQTVPAKTFGVGISMSGAGTYITQAGPNLRHTFTPTPNYWIAAGTNVRVGTVLDITTITLAKQVIFPPDVYQLNFALNTSNIWVPQ